jgi:hypothetical protein
VASATVELILANGRGVALIDAEDAARIPLDGWYLHGQGYAAHRPIDGQSLLHRIVMSAPKGSEVDHINHDKLDCRKSNLRFVNRSQNNQNRRRETFQNISGFRNVSTQFNKSGSVSYYARVQVNKKTVCRCGFKNPQDAAIAAAELRRQYFTHSAERD